MTEDKIVDGITDSMDMGLGGLRELVMPSNHHIICCPLLLLPSIFPSIRVLSNELPLFIRWSNTGASDKIQQRSDTGDREENVKKCLETHTFLPLETAMPST